ncbi:43kDa postsynaptic protein [Trema orientale]|uniref:RING-type E3 ubiquitin transferase n=1 Tax=Trema orientale TaxID=63057 RepID=A0A2P5FPE9_TREOI|nr:43kDa postsynaptic protein [Trema orientale]
MAHCIYVSTEKIETVEDEPLEYHQVCLVVNVVQKYFSEDTHVIGRTKNDDDDDDDFVVKEDTSQEVLVSANYLASDQGVLFIRTLLSAMANLIPLRLKHLRWMENSAPPQKIRRLDDLVTKILDAVAGMVSEARFAHSGSKRVGMQVTIDKHTVVSRRRYLELLHDDQLPRYSMLAPSSVPAAGSSVEALERLRYEYNYKYSSDDGEEDDEDEDGDEDCVICLEKVLRGSQVIRMPCSHMFHSNCILRWLGTRHSCPLCRFELPTSDVN